MQQDTFNEKLYTSTEVAEILGVSLRSIYRYLDDNKIQAAVKTATGRHRFTRQNINDFLHPSESKAVKNFSQEKEDLDKPQELQEMQVRKADSEEDEEEVNKVANVQSKEDIDTQNYTDTQDDKVAVQDEPVDWLARFRQAAEKYKTQDSVESIEKVAKKAPKLEEVQKVQRVEKIEEMDQVEKEEESTYYYYRSGVGGLKEIAQAIDKSAKNASLDYAFTMGAGLSLHKPIKPFSLIHSYARPTDLAYFEKVLQLTPCQKDTAQLCLITSEDEKLYAKRRELHGLYVVSDSQIKADLLNDGETELANELD
jgi:excisionase family DNA binding protein